MGAEAARCCMPAPESTGRLRSSCCCCCSSWRICSSKIFRWRRRWRSCSIRFNSTRYSSTMASTSKKMRGRRHVAGNRIQAEEKNGQERKARKPLARFEHPFKAERARLTAEMSDILVPSLAACNILYTEDFVRTFSLNAQRDIPSRRDPGRQEANASCRPRTAALSARTGVR